MENNVQDFTLSVTSMGIHQPTRNVWRIKMKTKMKTEHKKENEQRPFDGMCFHCGEYGHKISKNVRSMVRKWRSQIKWRRLKRHQIMQRMVLSYAKSQNIMRECKRKRVQVFQTI